jgi:hypothetical protein
VAKQRGRKPNSKVDYEAIRLGSTAEYERAPRQATGLGVTHEPTEEEQGATEEEREVIKDKILSPSMAVSQDAVDMLLALGRS